ncbi:MAG TPA: hypothetical protein PKE45_24250 [Caldilineaceae bacterium]|nr:hypothetical protein [Caldilineaceae bacterium]
MLLTNRWSESRLLLEQSSDNSGVDTFESGTHSFLIRLWVEERSAETGQVTWRGQIIHVPSGKRQAISDPDEIIAFLMPYFAQMGVQWGIRARVKRWVRRLTTFFVA